MAKLKKEREDDQEKIKEQEKQIAGFMQVQEAFDMSRKASIEREKDW